MNADLNKYIDYKKYKRIIFVGNLPYYITTAIINKIIDYGHADEIIIMVQKEVADRFMAKPHSKNIILCLYTYNITLIL